MNGRGDSERRPARRYVPLVWRVAILNAALLIVAVIVTVVVLAPRKLSTVALDEASVLVGGLLLVALGNLLVLRRIVGPLEQVTELARNVDLSQPVRIPDAAPDSEAGELAHTFNEMLARLETERREATGRVLAGQEAERLRIAQELHDQIGQELTAVLLGLARARATAPDWLGGGLSEIQEAVRASLEDVRRIALELRPEALDELGLESALAVLAERFAERSGITVTQDIAPGLPELDPDVELVVYRIVQEALTNVARHSGATRATVTVTASGDDSSDLLVEIADAGQGLPHEIEAGTGIRGMRERAALVDGVLELTSGPAGAGCLVRLRITPAAAGATPPDGGSVARGDELADDAHPAR